MSDNQEIQKYALATISGLICGGLALLMRKISLENAEANRVFRPRKQRPFAMLEWETSHEQTQMALLIAVMDHPGLLFGFRDPTIRKSFNSDAKEFTDEYTVCVTQRLLFLATCNNTLKAKVLENCGNTARQSLLAFSEQTDRQRLAVKKGVKDSLFLVSRLIPDVPTSIAKESFELYEDTAG